MFSIFLNKTCNNGKTIVTNDSSIALCTVSGVSALCLSNDISRRRVHDSLRINLAYREPGSLMSKYVGCE